MEKMKNRKTKGMRKMKSKQHLLFPQYFIFSLFIISLFQYFNFTNEKQRYKEGSSSRLRRLEDW